MKAFAVALLMLSCGCGGTGTPDVVDVMSPVRGNWVDFDGTPQVTCTSVQFTMKLRLDSPARLSESDFHYTRRLDVVPADGGTLPAEESFSNDCFAAGTAADGTPTYRVCLHDLTPRSDYFVRVTIGFDGGMLQPAFRFGTPLCPMDASVQP